MSPVQNSDLISLLINIIKAIPDYYCWIHVGIGTIFVISGLKYILNQLKAFKYVKNVGAHVGRNAKKWNLARGEMRQNTSIDAHARSRYIAHV